jgi:hypothetical protein
VSDKSILSSVNATKSAVRLTASTEEKAAKKTKNTAISKAKKKAAPSKEIALGDKAKFKGGPHYASANATSYKVKPKAGPAKVTAISKKARHPYHIVHTDKTSTVYGWVDASLISK